MPGKIIILRGPPASGKTTLSMKLVETYHSKGTEVLNLDRDSFRKLYYGSVVPGDFEDNITQMQDLLFEDVLSRGGVVIESSTNLQPKKYKRFVALAERNAAKLEHIDVVTTLDECVERDRLRGLAGGHSVEPAVIKRFFDMGFPEFPASPKQASYIPYVEDPSLPAAVMVDLDGTLAEKGDRDIYDQSRCGSDLPRPAVISAVRAAMLYGKQIIFCSGRDDTWFDITAEWINTYVIPLGNEDMLEWIKRHLFMRKAGDKRRDSIVKYEMFNENIRGKYNISYVLDDRAQVVDMYRQIGLNVFQVQPGNF